ncbi:MAG: hypothetical protein IPQ07_06050 [Myxococcales bacterium]|nr:hypothetical protein [Myxococcales bacterium]
MTALVAMWCALRIDGANQTAQWPLWVKHATSAAAMGMVGVLAMLPRHLKLALDPVQAALRKLPSSLDAEVRNLVRSLGRDLGLHEGPPVRHRLPARTSSAMACCKTIEVAAKSADVKLTGANDTELTARMEELR